MTRSQKAVIIVKMIKSKVSINTIDAIDLANEIFDFIEKVDKVENG